MTLLARFRSWLKWIIEPSRLESEMESEVRFHIDSYAADLVRSAVPPQEAMRWARIEFGGVESHKDAMRASLGLRWLDELRVDLRYGARKLRRSLGFTLTAVRVLAIGIGVNVTAFNVVRFSNCLLLGNALQSQLLTIALTHKNSPNVTSVVSYGTLFGTLIATQKPSNSRNAKRVICSALHSALQNCLGRGRGKIF